MQSLSWYVTRLGRMSAAEVAHRFRQVIRSTHERLARTYDTPVPAPRSLHSSASFVHTPAGIDARPYVEAANRVLAGRYTIFHLEEVELGHPPRWNRDPLTGRDAPLLPASSLDYRDERLVGNIKYLWEPNRHLHLPTLAQAYVLTGERVYVDALRVHVDSWIDSCPPGRGPNWASPLELGIRLINWSITWQLIGGANSALFGDAEGRAFRDRWLASIFRHVRWIVGKLSRFSSANNHLIGESAGVYIASLTWGCWPQMHSWGRMCKDILEREALIQNWEDGGNKEQAFSYQQFVLDFLLLAGLAARAASDDFADSYWERIERMMEFIAAMMDSAGNVPMVGDADDGYVVRLAPHDGPARDDSRATATRLRPTVSSNYRSLLATGALLFDRADFARKVGQLDDKTRWLLPPKRVVEFERLGSARAPVAARRAFPQSGYYILGSDFDTPEEVWMLVDAGPLGYLSLAAHGHADALSIVLHIGGEEVLVDPGTYAYHTEPEWRRYFRGTRAHNTVSIDGRDQSTQGGNFMWSRHAVARCLHFGAQGSMQRFLGEHDGYSALREPVEHQREIVYDAGRRSFKISDILDGEGTHQVAQHWHFSEHLEPNVQADEISVCTARHRIRLVPVVLPARMNHYRGGMADQGGWVSRRFGHKVPSTTVVWHYTMRARAVLITHIYVEALDSKRSRSES
ncbi:MAG: alginate lyase family protein [Gammaproteobacteria bacterium]